MKIGILTFWWSNDNYGQLLQCYSLQKYLRELGHEAYIIRYTRDDISPNPLYLKLLKLLNPFAVVRHLRFLNYKRAMNQAEIMERNFDEFRKQHICMSEMIYTNYEDLKRNPPKADIYIVGSDQVWNNWNYSTKRYLNPLNAYFLNFGDESVKRLSYAASWGTKNISNQFVKIINPLLENFTYVSVREKEGIELCKKCGCDNAEWVCDPTLLLKAVDYRKLYGQIKKTQFPQNYVFVYMLSTDCDFNIHSVYDFAKKRNLEVVYVTGNARNDNNKKYNVTIPEWLYLIDNATYVITNSFHCGVFSTIFNKQYGIIPVVGIDSGMNSRFDSLFSLLNINNRFILKNDFSILDVEYTPLVPQKSTRFIEAIGGDV